MTRERETIARIIDPGSWSVFDNRHNKAALPFECDDVQQLLGPSLSKADDVLLALGPGEGLTERVTVLEAAIRWALGEGDSDFGDNIPTVRFLGGKPARYWWRTELRERAALPSPPIPNREGVDLDELEKVARAATQKPWFRSGGRSDLYDGNRPLNGHGICLEGDKQDTIAHVFFDKRTGEGFSDANHIATFDPPTVLKLIALARLNPPAASGGGDKEGFMVSQGNLPPPSAAQDAEMWAPCTECGAEPLIMHREDCPVMLANLANLANLGSPLVRGGE